jgi:hypothetical protein
VFVVYVEYVFLHEILGRVGRDKEKLEVTAEGLVDKRDREIMTKNK